MFDDDKDDFLNPFGDKNKNGYYDAEDRWIHENYFGDDGESERKKQHKSGNESSGHKSSSSSSGSSGSLFEIIILIMLAIQPLLLMLVVATSGSGMGSRAVHTGMDSRQLYHFGSDTASQQRKDQDSRHADSDGVPGRCFRDGDKGISRI
jgi:hypothetical protein